MVLFSSSDSLNSKSLSMLFICFRIVFLVFILVENDQNIVYISFVVVYFFAFQSLFYIYLFQKLKVKLCLVLEMGDPMAMPFSVWKN